MKRISDGKKGAEYGVGLPISVTGKPAPERWEDRPSNSEQNKTIRYEHVNKLDTQQPIATKIENSLQPTKNGRPPESVDPSIRRPKLSGWKKMKRAYSNYEKVSAKLEQLRLEGRGDSSYAERLRQLQAHYARHNIYCRSTQSSVTQISSSSPASMSVQPAASALASPDVQVADVDSVTDKPSQNSTDEKTSPPEERSKSKFQECETSELMAEQESPSKVDDNSVIELPECHKAEKQSRVLNLPTMNAADPEEQPSALEQNKPILREEVGPRGASRSANSKMAKALCPRCAGKKLEKDIVNGRKHLCRECGLSFDEPLKVPPCPRCKSPDYVSRKTWKILEGGKVWVVMRCGNDGNGNKLRAKGCNVSFLLTPEQRYKRLPPKVYADALFRALQGASYSDIAQGLRHVHHVDRDEGTIRRWVVAGAYRASRYLLTLPLKCSGFIYLDEKAYTVHHKSEGGEWREEWWIWNSYDLPKKVWFQSLIRKGRGIVEAYEVIQSTLAKAIPPDNGEIYLWCDGLDKYRYAFERLVREGKIDSAKIHLVPIPKAKKYSCINEIEGLNSRIEKLIRKKLRPSIDEAGAQVRIDGERVQYLFVERVPEFGGKTRAMNAGVDLRLGDSEWEKIATLTQILKLQKFKNYELKVNVSDTQALKEMKTGRNDDPAYHVTNPEGNASDTEAHRDGPDRGTESNEGKPASSCALDQPNQDQKTDAPNESVVTKGHETECYNNLNTSRSVRVPYVTSFKIYL